MNFYICPRKIKSFLMLIFSLYSLSSVASTETHIMISGFDPFSGATQNNSWKVATEIKKLADANGVGKLRVSLCLLPTVYDQAALVLQDCLKASETPVDQVISLGEELCSLSFETVAHNKDNARSLDNNGERRSNSTIRSSAPKIMGMSLPIHRYYCELKKQNTGLDMNISDNAGGFVCNNTAFHMLHYLESELPYMFIHVPNSKCSQRKYDPAQLALGLYKTIESRREEERFSMPTSFKGANKLYKKFKSLHRPDCETRFFKKLRWKLVF